VTNANASDQSARVSDEIELTGDCTSMVLPAATVPSHSPHIGRLAARIVETFDRRSSLPEESFE
jgi:hypothetical protein